MIQKKVGNKDVIMQPYSGLPCELEVFTINGVSADKGDFGRTYDSDREGADDYCCGCMIFERCNNRNIKQRTMDKYSLSWEEYDEICELLEDELYVGSCGLCS